MPDVAASALIGLFKMAFADPQASAGWGAAAYLMYRLHQITDRQHEAAVETNKVLAAIKTFLITKFGGTVE